MPSEVQIKIKSSDETKEGFDSAVNTAEQGAKRVNNAVSSAGGDLTGMADKIGHTGEVAAKMAVNIAQAFGMSGKDSEKMIEYIRRIDDGFDALGKAAQLATVANTAVAASNVTVATTAGGATTAMGALTAVMMANPITAILTAIGIAAAAVAVAYSAWPEATDDISAMTEELKKQKDAVDKLVQSLREQVVEYNLRQQLVDRASQRRSLTEIEELDSVEAAKKVQDTLISQVSLLEQKLRLQQEETKKQAEAAVIQKEREKSWKEEFEWYNMPKSKVPILETEVVNSLQKEKDLKEQIAALTSQAEAAQDRQLAIPDELKKKELDRIKEVEKAEEEAAKKKLKHEEELKKKKDKDAAERLKAEELYATAIEDMNEEKRKAKEDKEKESKKDKSESRFVGLEDLGRNIQLAALTTSKEAADRAAMAIATKETAIKTARLIELHEKSIDIFETMADDTKITAEKIEKVGTLA